MVDREVEEKLRRLAPVRRDEAERAWRFYLAGDSNERREASDWLDVLLFRAMQKDFRQRIFLSPAVASECDGEYRLGVVLYPPDRVFAPFGLREAEWIRHVLIVGATGTGKTNLVYHLLRTLRSRDKPFLVFDWKRSYRDLLQFPEFADLQVFTVGRKVRPFRFNPLLPPPGTSPGAWLMKLVDVLKHAYFVGEGVEYVLRRALDYAYDVCGYHDGTQREVPTFQHVRAFVLQQRLHGRMALWKASALRVLESLCFRHGLGPVVNGPVLTRLVDLLRDPVVLELDTLADADKVFLTEALILWLYEYRRVSGVRERFAHALVIEEAHHVLSELKERTAGVETVLETSLRQIREYGQAVIVVDQEPVKVSHSMKANTNCKITFNLGNPRDVTEMARSLGLHREDFGYVQLLPVGSAIVGLRRGQFAPALVAFPKVSVRKGLVTDADLTRMQDLSDTA